MTAPDRISASKVDPRHVLRGVDLRVSFQGVDALSGVSLTLSQAEIMGLIGPNGAGKTTLVNVLTGFQRPTTGRVWINDTDVTRSPPHQRTRLGLGRTFQNGRAFRGLTVLENIEAGGVGIGLSRRAARSQAWELLELMGFAEMAHAPAHGIPYGDERRLGIARALASRPLFLLMDEPAAGVDEEEMPAFIASVRALVEDHRCGVLIIDHNMELIFDICERVHLLDQGRTIAEGTSDMIRSHEALALAYLGEGGTA